jgi:cobalt-zinc-cadmium efflux system membrane fusion protein
MLPNSAVARPKRGAFFSLSQRVRENAGPAKMATYFFKCHKCPPMKKLQILSSLWLAILITGCQHSSSTDQTGEPKVTGEKISFPAGSPQLSALELAPAELQAPANTPLSGRLAWDEDVTVRVFTPFAGRVDKVLADIGQTVEKNGALAAVESPDFGQAQSDARKAESAMKLAEQSLVRERELFAHGAAAQKDVEAAEDAENEAAAEHSRAVAKLAAYGATANSVDEIFTLESPLAGTVVDKRVTPGQEIRPDQMLANIPEVTDPLFVVSDPSHLWILIDATEPDVMRLQPGREFTFTARAFPDEVFTGRVDKVSGFIDQDTRTIKVRGSVDNPSGRLKAAMFVNVDLANDAAPSLCVPTKAVFLKGEKHYVFVQESPGEFTREEVVTGSEQDGRIPIISGLQAGQQVVTEGCILLQQMLGE